MITLYQLARTWDMPNLSHFCVKVETYLRMTGLPYQVTATLPIKAPRGKLPFIEDEGKKISDFTTDHRLPASDLRRHARCSSYA